MAIKQIIDKIDALEHSRRLIKKAELITGIILTLAAIFLHLTFMRNAGAFWRDEVNSINLATMPTIADIWRNLNYDCFPILFSLILRTWTNLLGADDLGLRIFGLIVGLFLLCVLWLNGRLLRYRVPLLSLALFVFNPLSIKVTDSIRPYGIGIALLLLTFGLIWKLTQQAKPWLIVFSTITAILSVHCLYQNAFFLASIILAGAVATIYNRQWKEFFIIITIGLVAAASFLPYLKPLVISQYWVSIIKRPLDFLMVLRVFISALNIDGGYFYLMWCGLILLSFGFIISVGKSPSCRDGSRNFLLQYCLITMVLSVTAQLFFTKNMQVPVWPRYFLPVMVIIAMFLDIVLSSFNKLNVVRIILAIIITITSFNTCKQSVQVRQTNIDIIASRLENIADKDDIVVINPWYLAVSFQKYYHGKASYTTLPPIEDYGIHRFDLVRKKMISLNPVESVISRASDCLASKHSIWIVGWIESFQGNQQPQQLPPAPNSKYRWNMFAYTNNWEEQFVYFIQSNSMRGYVLPPVINKPVNSLENCSIMKVEGSQ